MIPQRLTLNDMQVFARDVQNKLDSLLVRNVDMSGRRTINAGRSQGEFDYVVKLELEEAVKQFTLESSHVGTGLLNASTEVDRKSTRLNSSHRL